MRRRFPIAALLVLVSACGRQDPVPPTQPLPPTIGWQVERPGAPPAETLGAIGHHLFTLRSDGTLRAMDLATGDICWERSFEKPTMAVAPDRLVIHQAQGTLDALLPFTGKTAWTTLVPVRASGPPVVADGKILIAGEGACLLTQETGERLWCVTSPRNLTTAVGIVDDLVLAADDEVSLHALDARDGSLRWTYQASGRILTPPVGDGEHRVFVGTSDGWILGLDTGGGSRKWRWHTGSDTIYPGLVLDNHVWFACQNALLYGLRRNNGNQDFRLSLPSRPVGPPLFDGEFFVVPCYSANASATTLMAFLAETGRRMRAAEIPGEMRAWPIIVGRRMIMAPRDGSLNAYDLAEPTPTPDELESEVGLTEPTTPDSEGSPDDVSPASSESFSSIL